MQQKDAEESHKELVEMQHRSCDKIERIYAELEHDLRKVGIDGKQMEIVKRHLKDRPKNPDRPRRLEAVI